MMHILDKYIESDTGVRIVDIWYPPARNNLLFCMCTVRLNKLFGIKYVKVYRSGRVKFPTYMTRGGEYREILKCAVEVKVGLINKILTEVNWRENEQNDRGDTMSTMF